MQREDSICWREDLDWGDAEQEITRLALRVLEPGGTGSWVGQDKAEVSEPLQCNY